MVQWLLSLGFDPNEVSESGWTALFEAASAGDADCVRMLLDAGADVHFTSIGSSAIGSASTLAVVRVLVGAGAVLDDLNREMRMAMTRLPLDGKLTCSPEHYRSAKHRIFGTTNPERMNFPFWKAMVACGGGGYRAKSHFAPEEKLTEAVWCYDRYGKSITELPDGRIIEIGGEHEDYYDPDFCIYNDVVVHRGDGTFDIYGYPEAVFPPTDFHSATLVGDSIYIIGRLGYQGQRQFGTTPVYRLDIHTLAIETVETSGELPGWIYRHRAKVVERGIEVWGGELSTWVGDEERYEDNTNIHVLNPITGLWSRP